MNSITLFLIPLLLLTTPISAQTPPPQPPESEMTILGIKLDMPAKQIIQKIGSPSKKDKPIDHDEVTCSLWHYPKKGLTLAMVEDKRDDSVTLNSLVIESPSSLKLRNGIKIGDTLETIQKAYAPYYGLLNFN